MPAIAPPRGTSDLLPEDATAWLWLHDLHARMAGAYGYELCDTPIFEHTELFERGVGGGTDVVDKEMYTFTDRGGRSLTLRPEGTAGVLRAVLGASLTQERRPVRVRYAGPMFRYDRPQRGRYRQFSQVGVECIGERSPHLDAEVIELAWRFVAALGIDGVSLQLNSLGDREDRERYRAALLGYYEPLRDRLCDDCRRRLRINPLRLLDCKRDAGLAAAAPLLGDSLSQASAAHLDTVVAALDAAGVPSTRNQRLVRGLDYYAHTAFELWHTSLRGSQNALGGGGRYDGLAEELGFAAAPGIGYALGVDRLLLTAAELGVAPGRRAACEVVVCSVELAQAGAAAAAATRLRDADWRVVLDVGERRLARKLSHADRLGARLCVIVGEDEAAGGRVVVRDLRTRSQESVAGEAMVEHVGGLLAGEAA